MHLNDTYPSSTPQEPSKNQNYFRLKSLPADKAIRFYLEGRFTIGEETALVDAVQEGMSLSIRGIHVSAVIPSGCGQTVHSF